MSWITFFLDLIFPPRADVERIEAITSDTLLPLLSPTVVQHTDPRCIALASFKHPAIAALIREAKYHEHARAQTLLGTLVSEYLLESADPFGSLVLIPIPLHSDRLRERGFNQCERILAEALRALGEQDRITMDTTLLERVRDTGHQTRLSRTERLTNVQGAFRTTKAPSSDTLYIVFDDVLTTGATMQEACKTLIGAGGVHTSGLSIAS